MESPALTPGALAYAAAERARFIEDLKQLVRFPSVSGQTGHVTRCAEWLARHLRSVGLDTVSLLPGARHPIVLGEWRLAPGRPTVLIYGHYDVQPPDPLDEWRSQPFSPVVQDGYLHGRGTSDDKGPMLAHVKAVESYLQSAGRLPVNTILLLEGEEEVGSPGLRAAITTHRSKLAADLAVVSDTRMLGPGRPAISFSERGSLSLELEVRGPRHDVHSGEFGGAVHNPIQALCEIVGNLHDARARVAIPGFYDRVRTWDTRERAFMARTGPTDAELLRAAEVDDGWGEAGYTLYERTTIRPALTLNGITGGYQGTGGKSIVPASARAKINVRLVPDQDPEDIERLFRQHVARMTPHTVRSRVRSYSSSKPAMVDRHHPGIRAASVALSRAFAVPPVLVRSGGTIPVVSIFEEELGISTILMGFALPDDRMHAPNERFYLPNYVKGIETSIRFLAEIARWQRGAFESGRAPSAALSSPRTSA